MNPRKNARRRPYATPELGQDTPTWLSSASCPNVRTSTPLPTPIGECNLGNHHLTKQDGQECILLRQRAIHAAALARVPPELLDAAELDERRSVLEVVDEIDEVDVDLA